VARRLTDMTFVKVWLETGRRNQIRVHFAESGHPVLGDPRYEPELAAHRLWPYKRLALHARQLGLEHPITGQHLRFESPLPAEMDRLLT
jgi:23S rRNA pseudouridine1911/1915/1917 synthase